MFSPVSLSVTAFYPRLPGLSKELSGSSSPVSGGASASRSTNSRMPVRSACTASCCDSLSVPSRSASTNASNRTSYTATITSTQNTTYAYDAANRLVNVGGVAYTWDDLGRLTNDGTYSFTWDAASRLISASETQAVTVTGGGVTIGFRYDGDGNRLAQIGDGTFTTHTLDIGLALPEVLARQGSGWSELYVHLPNAVATKEGTAWRYSAANGLGSVRQELDSSEGVDGVNSYRPFGLPLEGDGGDPYGFTGEWWDGSEDRGLLFLRARYYEPYLNRFISPDTIVPDYAFPPSIHRYSYVYNNAVNYTDPSGLRCLFFDENCDELIRKGWDFTTQKAAPYLFGGTIEFLDRQLFGIPRVVFPWLFDVDNAAFHIGRYGGRAVSDALSTLELLLGCGLSTGGLALSGSGVGALAGVPASAVGLMLTAHGAVVLVQPREPIPERYFAETGQGSGEPSYETVEDAQREIESWGVEENLKNSDEWHLDAARNELRGERVHPTRSHIQEVRDARRGLKKGTYQNNRCAAFTGLDSRGETISSGTV